MTEWQQCKCIGTVNYEGCAQKQQCSLTLVVGFNGTAPKTFSGGGGGEKHQK